MRSPSSSVRRAVLLACVASHVLAAPLPQLAGFGDACNSILSSTDNGVGYGVENAEDNTANLITAVKSTPPPAIPAVPAAPAAPARRQLAGEGAACDSILTSTDNGAGYGVKNAETNTANLVAPAGQAVAGQVPKTPRQLDKIADGAGTLAGALGLGPQTGPTVGELDTVDGQSTSDAATVGQQVGDDEATTLEDAGSLVP